MSLLLGDYAFDPLCTTVTEKYEEAGGRDARHIRISGVLRGFHSVSALEAALDAVLAAVPAAEAETTLVLRPGRRLWVRRLAFSREIARNPVAGAFTLDLEAPDPFEESVEEHTHAWEIAAQGAALALDTAGNRATPLRITLSAVSDLIDLEISDGLRTLRYEGIVGASETLTIDGAAGKVLLSGEDIMPYTKGAFPHVAPGGTTLTFSDDDTGAHQATATVAFRDRWW